MLFENFWSFVEFCEFTNFTLFDCDYRIIWSIEFKTSSELAAAGKGLLFESDEFIFRLNSSLDGIDCELHTSSASFSSCLLFEWCMSRFTSNWITLFDSKLSLALSNFFCKAYLLSLAYNKVYVTSLYSIVIAFFKLIFGVNGFEFKFKWLLEKWPASDYKFRVFDWLRSPHLKSSFVF